MEEETYTVQEAARILRTTERTVRRRLERLVPTHGTVLELFLGEDEIIRGERQRSGPPVRETSPGVYETDEGLSE